MLQLASEGHMRIKSFVLAAPLCSQLGPRGRTKTMHLGRVVTLCSAQGTTGPGKALLKGLGPVTQPSKMVDVR